MLLLFALAVFATAHPSRVAHDFHVSRLTVNHNTARGQLELTLDTFVDDVERAIGSRPAAGLTPESVDLVTPGEHPAADSLLAEYLLRVLRLEAHERVPLRYLGKEAADDPYAVYAYLVAELPPDEPVVRLSSAYLLDLYDDQQNIVVWQRDGRALDYDLLTAAQQTAQLDP